MIGVLPIGKEPALYSLPKRGKKRKSTVVRLNMVSVTLPGCRAEARGVEELKLLPHSSIKPYAQCSLLPANHSAVLYFLFRIHA